MINLFNQEEKTKLQQNIKRKKMNIILYSLSLIFIAILLIIIHNELEKIIFILLEIIFSFSILALIIYNINFLKYYKALEGLFNDKSEFEILTGIITHDVSYSYTKGNLTYNIYTINNTKQVYLLDNINSLDKSLNKSITLYLKNNIIYKYEVNND